MTATAYEEALVESLPDGFTNTFIEGSRLRRLQNNSTDNLNNTVEEYQNFTLTEADVINTLAQKVLTGFVSPERTIELPGLALAVQEDLLAKWSAGYKMDNDTPSGTIKDPERAEVDDIILSPLTPEIFKEITGDNTLSPNYISENLTAGNTLNVVGNGGHDNSANSGDPLSLDLNEQVFFTGDFVDLSQGQSVITATQYPDVDGADFGPSNAIAQTRHSGFHVMTTQGSYATDSVQVDAKIYEDGDAELRPVGFYLGPGRNAPNLV